MYHSWKRCNMLVYPTVHGLSVVCLKTHLPMQGSRESSFFFCKVFCVTPVDLQKGKQVLECLNTGEEDCCQPQSLRVWDTCGSFAAAAWDGDSAQSVPSLSRCSHDSPSPSASLCCGWPFFFPMMRNLVCTKFLLYLRRIIAVEPQTLLLLCYWTVSAGFEMLTGFESSFILQSECS